eukprot:gb/GECG01010168.1/.p1 GENE.gb/GECG01010168.1/~~gb/GECG01010168.1/.p1  ORF type:complete len:1185 (+),score=91.59 gb/GECG01010168.1/:1-3555(+)
MSSHKSVRTYEIIREENEEGDTLTPNGRFPGSMQHTRTTSLGSSFERYRTLSGGDTVDRAALTGVGGDEDEGGAEDDMESRTVHSSTYGDQHTSGNSTPFHAQSQAQEMNLDDRLLRYVRRFLSIRNLALTIIISNAVFTIIAVLMYYNFQIFYYYLWPLFWALLCSLALWNIKENLTNVLRTSLQQEDTFFLIHMAQWPVEFFRDCKDYVFHVYYMLFGDKVRMVVEYVEKYMGTWVAALSAQMAFMREQLGYDGSFFSPRRKPQNATRRQITDNHKDKSSKASSKKTPHTSLRQSSKKTSRSKHSHDSKAYGHTPETNMGHGRPPRQRGVAFTNQLPSRYSELDGNNYTPRHLRESAGWKSVASRESGISYLKHGTDRRLNPQPTGASNRVSSSGVGETPTSSPSLHPTTGSGLWWMVLGVAYVARIMWGNPWFVLYAIGGFFLIYQLNFMICYLWHCTKRYRSNVGNFMDSAVGWIVQNRLIRFGKQPASPQQESNQKLGRQSSSLTMRLIYSWRKQVADQAAEYSDSFVSLCLISVLTVCGIVFFFVFALQCAMETYTFFSETKLKVGDRLDVILSIHNSSMPYTYTSNLTGYSPWWSVNSVNELIETSFDWMEPSWPNETTTARQVWGIIREFNETIVQKTSNVDHSENTYESVAGPSTSRETLQPNRSSTDQSSKNATDELKNSSAFEVAAVGSANASRTKRASNTIITDSTGKRNTNERPFCELGPGPEQYANISETQNPARYWLARTAFIIEELFKRPFLLHPRCWMEVYQALVANVTSSTAEHASLGESTQGKGTFYERVVALILRMPLPGWERVAESMSSILTHVSAALTLAGRHFFQATASVTQFMVSFFLFLSFLYYLLSARRDWMTMMFDFLEDQELERVRTDLSNCVQQVFVINIKVSLYHGLFTWLLFDVFEAPFAYTSTLLATLSAVIPFMPNWLVALPAACFLMLSRGIVSAGIFWSCHFLWLWYGDSYMYEEMQQIHHFLVGLSILGGFYTLGLQGAVIGPLLISVVSACYSLFKVYFLQNANVDGRLGDLEEDGKLTRMFRQFDGATKGNSSQVNDPTQKQLFVSGTRADYENSHGPPQKSKSESEEFPFSVSHSSSSPSEGHRRTLSVPVPRGDSPPTLGHIEHGAHGETDEGIAHERLFHGIQHISRHRANTGPDTVTSEEGG